MEALATGMIVKFLLPKTDLDAWETVVRFENDGIASLATDRMHLGLVRQIGEENGKIAIVADVDEPRPVSAGGAVRDRTVLS